MNSAAVLDLLDSEVEQIRKLFETKGQEYTQGAEDQLANFKKHAAELGLAPEQVWAVYASKHWDSIMSYIKNEGQVLSEPIEERIRDEILYLFLLRGLVEESKVPLGPSIAGERV